ncbi:MAG: L-histidine N(alpha)-methyltransferase [Pseudomonadota bacterium]
MLTRPILLTETADTALPARTPEQLAFAADLAQAFTLRPRAISPKYFYDAQGSKLFEKICELPEYYPTRTERGILMAQRAAMAAEIGADAEIVEFGAGSCEKVRLLLDVLERPRRYRPVDISAEHLACAVDGLRKDYPGLDVQPLAADYTQRLLLPAAEPGVRRVGFFPGSTLGNFTPAESLQFLRMAGQALRGGGLLLGVDLVKDPRVLHAAYNDSQGVTAAFNLNLLARANRELGCGFALDAFAHSAFYNAPLQRVEMHLVSRRRQNIVLDGQRHSMDEGETLHTENSHKFTIDGLRALALRAGLQPGPVWVDEQRWFSVHWLRAPD